MDNWLNWHMLLMHVALQVINLDKSLKGLISHHLFDSVLCVLRTSADKVGSKLTHEWRLWVQSLVNLRLVSACIACRAFKFWESNPSSKPEKLRSCSFVVYRFVYFSRLPLTERLVRVVISHSLEISECGKRGLATLLRSSCLREGQSLSKLSACRMGSHNGTDPLTLLIVHIW